MNKAENDMKKTLWSTVFIMSVLFYSPLKVIADPEEAQGYHAGTSCQAFGYQAHDKGLIFSSGEGIQNLSTEKGDHVLCTVDNRITEGTPFLVNSIPYMYFQDGSSTDSVTCYLYSIVNFADYWRSDGHTSREEEGGEGFVGIVSIAVSRMFRPIEVSSEDNELLNRQHNTHYMTCYLPAYDKLASIIYGYHHQNFGTGY